MDFEKKYLISNGKDLKFLAANEIIYLEADGNYTMVITNGNKKYVSLKKIKEFEKTLPEAQFARVHNSFIINLSFVDRIVNDSESHIVLENETIIPISRRKKASFLGRFNKI